MGCLFVWFIVSFAVQKLLSLIRSYLFVFVFIFIPQGGGSKKILPWFMSKSVFPKRVFIESGLTFTALKQLYSDLNNNNGNAKSSILVSGCLHIHSSHNAGDCLWKESLFLHLSSLPGTGIGLPGGSDGKESACHAGDLGSIPGLERSPGEGKGYLFSPEESPWTGYSPWSHKESDMIESD